MNADKMEQSFSQLPRCLTAHKPVQHLILHQTVMSVVIYSDGPKVLLSEAHGQDSMLHNSDLNRTARGLLNEVRVVEDVI